MLESIGINPENINNEISFGSSISFRAIITSYYLQKLLRYYFNISNKIRKIMENKAKPVDDATITTGEVSPSPVMNPVGGKKMKSKK